MSNLKDKDPDRTNMELYASFATVIIVPEYCVEAAKIGLRKYMAHFVLYHCKNALFFVKDVEVRYFYA